MSKLHLVICLSGSPAQLCHLQAGDEIVALAGQRVAKMSYEQWKANMDAALREGKLLMDIRRVSLNGNNNSFLCLNEIVDQKENHTCTETVHNDPLRQDLLHQ